ncbi:MAG: UbiD family decarboxylase, partial [Desulfuromonadales bacterium]|nr:UbiD family decarboxylase [Desulfuromonadales bacterium]
MYFADLQSFIAHLDAHDNLATVKVTVDPYLEIAAIVDRVCKRPGDTRALLFENVKGSKLPLAANLFGSQQRISLALGVADVEELVCRLRNDLKAYNGVTAGQALARLTGSCVSETHLPRAAPWFKTDVSKAGLANLPALHSWRGDGGRYLTLGQVFTRHPDGSRQNCGMYRVQILDKHTALIRCHPGSGGGAHMAAWHEQGKAMPLAIVLGGPPALTWCAGISLPGEVSELEFTRYLSGQSISVSQCQDSDLQVPTSSEIVIEGHINPGEEKTEGPFGNHTGYYTPAAPAPMIRITSVFTRDAA